MPNSRLPPGQHTTIGWPRLDLGIIPRFDPKTWTLRIDGDVWVANYNAPGQVVIAGAHDCVARASTEAKELGAKKVMPLQVGGAFHTPFMGPARGEQCWMRGLGFIR